MSEKIQISNAAKNTRMAFKDQINQNVGFFIYNREFLFFSGIIGSPQDFNRFQIIPGLMPEKRFLTGVLEGCLVKWPRLWLANVKNTQGLKKMR